MYGSAGILALHGLFLSLCSRVVQEPLDHFLGLFVEISSLGVFLLLCESSTSRSFLGKCAGLVCCKAGGGAGCFPFCGHCG